MPLCKIRRAPTNRSLIVVSLIVTSLSAVLIVLGAVEGVERWGKDLRYSIYYKGRDLKHVLNEEREREKSAKEFEHRVRSGEVLWPQREPRDAIDKRRLCVAFVTAERAGEPSRYAGHAFRSVFENMTAAEGSSVYSVAIVRGESSPVPHILNKFDLVLPARNAVSLGSNLRLETADYVAALHACRQLPYVLVLQDDVEAVDRIVSSVEKVIRETDETVGDWTFLKLFYHEFWDGWSTETTYKLVLFCIAVAWVSLAAFLKLFNRIVGRGPLSVLLAIIVVSSVLFVAAWVPYAVGRQHLVPAFYRGVNLNRGSAAVAILYNNRNGQRVPNLIEFLKSSKSAFAPIDLKIDAFAELNAPGFIYSPSLFQHLGLQSSINHKSSLAALPSRLEQFKQSMTFRKQFL